MEVCAGLKSDGGDARSAARMHLKYSEKCKKQLCKATLFTEVKNTGTHQEIGSFLKDSSKLNNVYTYPLAWEPYGGGRNRSVNEPKSINKMRGGR